MSDLKIEEYKALRQELDMYRKFDFERPLLIGICTLAVAVVTANRDRLVYLPIPSLIILLFNLYFTYNRLTSCARIVSYIQLVHEPLEPNYGWIGWESSLRMYLSLDENGRNDNGSDSCRGSWKPCVVARRASYHLSIFLLHLILAFFIIVLYWLEYPASAKCLWDFMPAKYLFGPLPFLLFLVLAIWLCNPAKAANAIELHRNRWERALKDFRLD